MAGNATIRQGVEYEITANDKSGQVVDAAMARVDQAAKKTGESIGKAGAEGVKGFSPMRAVTAALSGNFAAMGSELAKLIPSFQKSGTEGVAALGAVSGAVFALIKLFGALKDLVKVAFNLGAAPKELQEVSSKLADLKNRAENFGQAMAEARENAERQAKIYEQEIDAINKLTKAQNEFNRAQELALATSKEMRDEINRRYDSTNAQNDEDAAALIRQNKRQGLEDEGKRLQDELKEAEKLRDEYLETSRDMGRKGREAATGFWGDIWAKTKSIFTGRTDGNEKANALFDAGNEASNNYFDQLDKIEEIKKKIEENRHAQEIADIEDEAAEEESFARQQKEHTEEIRIKDEQIQQEAERSAEEIAANEKSAEEELQRQRLANIRQAKDAYLASASERSDAERRLAAAQSKVAEAWGWYRNKDSMAKQLEEEKANAEAEVQFEKDFDRLRRFKGSDWRNAKNLTVDEEAVRRVALAREEEREAAKELSDISQHTAYLEDIYNIMSGEDQ